MGRALRQITNDALALSEVDRLALAAELIDSEATGSDTEQSRVVRYDIEVENRAPADGLPRYTVGPWRSIGSYPFCDAPPQLIWPRIRSANFQGYVQKLFVRTAPVMCGIHHWTME